jgi:hypothetical protein
MVRVNDPNQSERAITIKFHESSFVAYSPFFRRPDTTLRILEAYTDHSTRGYPFVQSYRRDDLFLPPTHPDDVSGELGFG